MKRNRDNADNEEIEDGPYVTEIVVPPNLFKHALRRGYETYKEVGFYLIGLFKSGICYIHDLIEFDYSEQSGGFIESGMARYIRLKAGLPLGLQIIGHMHKHPGFTSYSATDKRNFLQYGYANPLNAFLIYMVDPYEEVRGYTATAHEIFPLKVTIRDFSPEEELLEKEIKMEFTTKVLLPNNTKVSDFRLLFSENIGSESLKFLSRPTVLVDGQQGDKSSKITKDSKIEIAPRKAIEIKDIANNTSLQYRIFMEEQETIADLETALKQLINFPREKGYEIIFSEAGRKLPRDTKLNVIKQPLVWSLEKSVLFPILKNFYRFWKGVIEILRKKQTKEKPKTLEDFELEVSNQLSSKSPEKTGSQSIFKNFSTFLYDLFHAIKEQEEIKSQKVASIQNEYDSPTKNSKKKKKNLKGFKLDYYT